MFDAIVHVLLGFATAGSLGLLAIGVEWFFWKMASPMRPSAEFNLSDGFFVTTLLLSTVGPLFGAAFVGIGLSHRASLPLVEFFGLLLAIGIPLLTIAHFVQPAAFHLWCVMIGLIIAATAILAGRRRRSAENAVERAG